MVSCVSEADQRCYLGVQIADEARHFYFFLRYHAEVLDTAPLTSDLPASMSGAYHELTFALTRESSEHAVAAPGDASALARAVFHFFIILEGTLAMATFSTLKRVLDRSQMLPGLRRGITFAQRDEVRHVQFGVSLLDGLFAVDPKARSAVAEHAARLLPLLHKVFEPQPERVAAISALGLDPMQRRAEAFAYLSRHLRLLGLSSPAFDGAVLS
jgi:hypothetical protein